MFLNLLRLSKFEMLVLLYSLEEGSPVMLALKNGHTEILKHLIEAKAYLDLKQNVLYKLVHRIMMLIN